MNLSEIKREISEALYEIYPKQEAENIARLLIEEIGGIPLSRQLSSPNSRIKKTVLQKLKAAMHRLQKNEPLQYIIGETEFYGLKFSVNPSVLIPRPETEELVEMIISQYRGLSGLRAADIGTGSACIALSLSANLDFEFLAACDISEKALQTARKNAKLNKQDIHLIKHDILQAPLPYSDSDFLVSNPPYVCLSEKKEMHENVKSYEPEQALFIPDKNALIFYEAIAESALHNLKKGGKLYFEINPAFAEELKTLLQTKGYKNIEIKKDLSGKKRFCVAEKRELEN